MNIFINLFNIYDYINKYAISIDIQINKNNNNTPKTML